MSKIETITAEQLDRLVDEGKEDVLRYFDLDNARRGSAGTKRINIDLPNDFLTQLDREASRRGIIGQSLIKVWLFDRSHRSGQEYQSSSIYLSPAPFFFRTLCDRCAADFEAKPKARSTAFDLRTPRVFCNLIQ